MRILLIIVSKVYLMKDVHWKWLHMIDKGDGKDDKFLIDYNGGDYSRINDLFFDE